MTFFDQMVTIFVTIWSEFSFVNYKFNINQ